MSPFFNKLINLDNFVFQNSGGITTVYFNIFHLVQIIYIQNKNKPGLVVDWFVEYFPIDFPYGAIGSWQISAH